MRAILRQHGALHREELFGQLLWDGFSLRSAGLALVRGMRKGKVVSIKDRNGFVTYHLVEPKRRAKRVKASESTPS
jgi:hypothetical protein